MSAEFASQTLEGLCGALPGFALHGGAIPLQRPQAGHGERQHWQEDEQCLPEEGGFVLVADGRHVRLICDRTYVNGKRQLSRFCKILCRGAPPSGSQRASERGTQSPVTCLATVALLPTGGSRRCAPSYST